MPLYRQSFLTNGELLLEYNDHETGMHYSCDQLDVTTAGNIAFNSWNFHKVIQM